MNLPDSLIREIKLTAERDYPLECCGFLIQDLNETGVLTHVPIRNAQNDLHAADPAQFPRTAQSAYVMDSKELLAVHKNLREKKREIKVIYHSHPDQEAYFSEMDQRLALDDRGEPVYANASYLVISVKAGRAGDWKLFHWDSAAREFKS